MTLFENAEEYIREEEEKHNFVLEVQEPCIIQEAIRFMNEHCVEYNLNDFEVIEENVRGHMYLNYKGVKGGQIKIFFRDREASGTEGKESTHWNSVKIIGHAEFDKTSIFVPLEGEEQNPLTIVGRSLKTGKPVTESDIPEVCEFIRKNARYLNAVYKSKSDFTKLRAIHQIQSHNPSVDHIDYTVNGVKGNTKGN